MGFAGGNNVAMRQILESKEYKYIVLLNIDTVVDKDWLTELVRRAELDSQIGAVQSLILLHDQPDLINTSGNQMHYLGFGWCGSYGLRVTGYGLRVLEIGYASGAAVLYRADVLRQVGLFDEKFFMYHEDLDLSWRIRLVGYKVVLAPKSLVYHKYQFSRNKKKWFWSERNRLWCFFSNYSLRTIILFLPIFIFMELGILLYSLIDGWFEEKIRSYGEILGSIDYIIKKRRQVQRIRRESDKAVLEYLTAKLDFAEIKNPLINYLASPILEGYFKMVRRWVR
jgi:GT2 family glycosyltransferase